MQNDFILNFGAPITQSFIHSSGTVEARVVKFRTQVGYIKCYQWHDISPQNGRRSGHVTRFKFLVPKISQERLKLETSNFIHWLPCEVLALGVINSP